MHAIFMPYGKDNWVSDFLNDIRAHKSYIKATSEDGRIEKKLLTQYQLRILPFGFYEVVFPREDLDIVLSTLNFPHKDNVYSDRYKIPEFAMKQVRKILRCKEAPTDFKRDIAFPWVRGIDLTHQDVYVLPIGIREDIDIIEKNGDYKGFKHEAI